MFASYAFGSSYFAQAGLLAGEVDLETEVILIVIAAQDRTFAPTRDQTIAVSAPDRTILIPDEREVAQ